MIIGSRFDGDSEIGIEISLAQSDVYDRALQLIISACRDHMNSALLLLGQDWPEKWKADGYFDHRTLCGAHDLIAAAWRYREVKAPLFDRHKDRAAIAAEWLSWLGDETASWKDQPDIVQNVLTVLAKQSQAAGFRASAALIEALLGRYSDVPWNASERDRVSQLRQIAADLDNQSQTKRPRTIRPKSAEACECVGRNKPPCGQIPCKTLCERADREGWGPLE